MKRYLTYLFVLLILTVLAVSVSAGSDLDYPTRNINVIIPYGAGGGTDTQFRIIMSKIEKVLGVTMVPKNIAGAGGTIGTRELAESDPDGYTIGFYGPSQVISAAYKDLGFTNADFIPLFGFAETPFTIITKDEKLNTTEKFVEYAKENPGMVTISCVGDTHLINVLAFEQAAGIDLAVVPCNSGAEGLNLVMGGHVHTAIAPPQFAISAEEQGGSIIGSFSKERMDTLPHVPTFYESGIDLSFVVTTLRIFVVPAGTPEPIIDILVEASREVAEGAEGEDIKEKLTNLGAIYIYRSGAELRDYFEKNSEKITTFVIENKNLFLAIER